MPIVVLSLQEAESNVGLTQSQVVREVELHLVRRRIMPPDREAAHARGWYLGVDLLIVSSAYHVRDGFHRRVTCDVVRRMYEREGIT